MDETPKLKGSILLDQMTYIRTLYGAEVLDRARASLSPRQRDEVDNTLPISWISTSSAQALKDAVAEQVGIDSLMFNRQVVRHGIGRTVTTLWRVFLRQLWDSAIIKRTPIIYAKTFDRGKLSLHFSGECTATFVLVGWPNMPEYDCVGLAEGIEALLEFSGRTDAVVKWRPDGEEVLFDATWKARK